MTTVNPVQTSAYDLDASDNPITFGAGTNIDVASGNGVYGDGSGDWTVTNYGTITGGLGVYLGGNDASLTNRGVIQGTGPPIGGGGGVALGNFGHIDNSGLIASANLYGILLFTGGTILNETRGTISGGEVGAAFGPIHIPSSAEATLTNYGVVTGGFEGVFGPVGLDTVINSGTITGKAFGLTGTFSLGDGVGFHQGGEVVNRAAGSISGARYGVYISGAAGTVTNFGVITGAKDSVLLSSSVDRLVVESGAKFVGAVVGGEGALELAGGTGTITGLGAGGTLSGSAAMIFSGFGSYQIDAGSQWTLAGVDTLGAGVKLATAGDLTVTGKLSGNVGVYVTGATGAVTNFGTIDGTGGTAVSLGSSSDELIAEAKSTFVGKVLGDGGLLDLASGVGTITGLLSGGTVTVSGSMPTTTFSNFGGVEIGAGASFTAAAGGSIAAGQRLIDDGTLSVGGGLSIAGALTTAGTLTGAGTVTMSGATVALGAGSSVSVARLVLAKGSIVVGGAVVASGAFATAAGTSTTIASGDTLTLTGSGSTLAGAISGAGAIDFAGGTQAVSAGASLGTAKWTTAGADATAIDESLTYAGTFTAGVGTSLAIAAGDTLTLTGASAFAGTVDGAGKLVLSGATDTLGAGASFTAARTSLTKGAASVIGKAAMGGAFVQSVGTGLSIASGDTLTLTGAGSTLAGRVSGAGTLAFAGASAALDTGASLSVARWSLSGGAVASLGESLAYAGAISQGTGTTLAVGSDTLTLTGADSALAGKVSGAGTLAFAGGTQSVSAGASFTTGHWTLGGGAKVAVSEALTYTGVFAQGAGTSLTVSTGDVLTLAGAGSTLAGEIGGAGTLAVARSVALNTGTGLAVAKVSLADSASTVAVNVTNLSYAGVWTQTAGALSVAKADRITFTGAGNSFTGTLGGAGTVAFTGGSDTLKGTTLSAGAFIINGPAVTLSGVITLDHTLAAATANLVIAAPGARLSGGGTVSFNDSATNRVYGAAASAILTNFDDTITGAGLLGDGKLVLVNDAAGVIDGSGAAGLTIDTGASIIANAGAIEATGGGRATITGAVDNTGTLATGGGFLTVDGTVTGAGVVKVNGGTADFASAFTENVAFTGTTGILELARSHAHKGEITGFSKTGTTSLDLLDIAFGAKTTAIFKGTTTSGVLTVTDGTHTANFTLLGDYLASTFKPATDGHGGVRITDPAGSLPARSVASAPLRQFISVAAAFGPTAGAPSGAGDQTWRAPPPSLSRPDAQIA